MLLSYSGLKSAFGWDCDLNGLFGSLCVSVFPVISMCFPWYRNVPEYQAAESRVDGNGDPLWTPAVKYGWAEDDGSGDQVFGAPVVTALGTKRRRKFGKILKLRENGLITGFNTLPNHVERDMLYKEAFDQKYFEPTLEARPFMASFDTNQLVNQGQVFRVVRSAVLFCAVVLQCGKQGGSRPPAAKQEHVFLCSVTIDG